MGVPFVRVYCTGCQYSSALSLAQQREVLQKQLDSDLMGWLKLMEIVTCGGQCAQIWILHAPTAKHEEAGGHPMPTNDPILAKCYHSNQYSADSACGHCAGVIRHEPWCVTCNENVAYAYAAVLDEARLDQQDKLILHALGARWIGTSLKEPEPDVVQPTTETN